MSTTNQAEKATLVRHLGFSALIFYGIGDVLGAGIYALVGKVASVAGPGAWLTFLFAALLAVITGLSYAELSARFPVAAGAAVFIQRAFKNRFLGIITGILVLSTGLMSAATITVAFSGYFLKIFILPAWLVQFFFVVVLSLFSFWGILQSSRINIALTLIEFFGLIAVIIAGFFILQAGDVSHFFAKNPLEFGLSQILAGMTIAFYAYIGFEDLCNLADEAKSPARDIPRAILISIGVSTILYMFVTVIMQMTLQHGVIAASATPLLLIFEKAGVLRIADIFSLIAMLAIANTGLANMIMASRLLYGMSQEGLLHSKLSKVHAKQRTPWVGILLAGLLVLLIVYTGSLQILAQTTSLLILIVFLLVHLSLIRVKLGKFSHDGFWIPLVLPIIGVVSCTILIARFPLETYLRSLVFFAAGIVLWVLHRKTKTIK